MTSGEPGLGGPESSPEVVVAGNPNSGKTTLFNLLTGARAKVGNYPGVTVDRRSARLALPGGKKVELVDLPGTYSLTARSMEERVALETLVGPIPPQKRDADPDAVVLVVDATTLRRGLYFASQILDLGVPAVLALNMMDEARAAGIAVDAPALGRSIGCEVVPIVAKRGEGKKELVLAIERSIGERGGLDARNRDGDDKAAIVLSGPLKADVEAIEALLEGELEVSDAKKRRSLALWSLLSLGDDELDDVPESLRRLVTERRDAARNEGRDLDEEIVRARYERIDGWLASTHKAPASPKRSLSKKIDSVLVHPVWGFIVFAFVMAAVFEALFSWAEPLMGLVDSAIGATKGALTSAMSDGPLRDLLVNGVVAGVGNVLVFIPQIALLFVFITILEDSGYLARVAFVIDRVMGGIGLNGKAFVPMLSGFACAIPAVMAARTIETRRDRLLTMLVIPLSSCSARLPVYVLVTAAVFAPGSRVLGVFSTGAVVLFAMYSLSIVAAAGSAAVFRRTILKGPRPALVLELPPYRMPSLRNVLVQTYQRVRRFVVDAGTVILALTIVLWALLSYPKDPAVTARYQGMRDEAAQISDDTEKTSRLAQIDEEQAGAELRGSAAGRLGNAIEPAIRPLGFDWRIGIGILGAFAAREVFVSTLGVVFNIADADEKNQPLREALQGATRPDGTRLFTPIVGISLMVFFVLAAQCMSTIAVVRRESGSWKWPAFLFGYMTVLAYAGSLFVYQVGSWLGWGTS